MVVCDRLAGSGVEVVALEDLSAPDFILPFGPVSGWFHAVSLPSSDDISLRLRPFRHHNTGSWTLVPSAEGIL